MVVYLLCMMTISFLGSEKFGGLNIIKYGWDMLLITFVSLLFYGWALKSGYKTEYMEAATEVNNELKAEKQDNEINEELSV